MDRFELWYFVVISAHRVLDYTPAQIVLRDPLFRQYTNDKEAYREPQKASRNPQGSYKNFQGRNPYNIFVGFWSKQWHQKDISKLTDF